MSQPGNALFKLNREEYLVERTGKSDAIKRAYLKAKKGNGGYLSLSGLAGTGKTQLVNNFIRDIKSENVLFAQGKFGQFGNSKPYSAIIQIIEQLINLVLLEDDHVFAEYQQAFKITLGENGSVITSLIPMFSTIIGEQSPPLLLGANETRNRFYQVIDSVFSVFSGNDRTLVLFFDDLQWADSSSIDLIAYLIETSWAKQSLIVGSYRSDEFSNNSALEELYKKLDEKRDIARIELSNFSEVDVKDFISSILNERSDRVDGLSEQVMMLTNGNPFYVSHYINTMFHDEKIWQDDEKWHWVVDNDAIVEGNADHFFMDSINKLSSVEKEFLRYGMCLKDNFRHEDVVNLLEHNDSIINEIVGNLESLGLIVRDNNKYAFGHDRILHSINAITDEEMLVEYKLKTGRSLLSNLGADGVKKRETEIVEYFNVGINSLTQEELHCVYELNQNSYQSAIVSGVYDQALNYSIRLLELYDLIYKEKDKSIKFTLLVNLSKSYYLNALYDKAKKTIDRALQEAGDVYAKLSAYSVYKDIVISESGAYDDIVMFGKHLLRDVGIAVPDDSEELSQVVLKTKERIDAAFNEKEISNQLHAPDLSDKSVQSVLILLNDLWEASYYAGDEQMMQYLILVNVENSLSYGNSSESAFGFVMAGMLETLQGNYDKAYDLGELALNLVEKYDDKVMLPKVFNLFCNYISFYKNPFTYSADLYQVSAKVGKNNGDYLFGLWATMFEVWSRFLSGQNLSEVKDICEGSVSFVEQTNDTKIIYAYTVLLDLLSLLTNKKGSEEDIKKYGQFIEYWQQDNFLPGIAWVNILLGQLYCIYGNFSKAYLLFTQAGVNTSPGIIMFPYAQYVFYSTFSALRYMSDMQLDYKKSLVDIDQHISIIKDWSARCPGNYEYQYYLLTAEKCVCCADNWNALLHFNNAISSAEKYSNNYSIAFCHEMKANFMRINKDYTSGSVHLQVAANYYHEWGAINKSALISPAKDLGVYQKIQTSNGNYYPDGHKSDSGIDFDTVLSFSQNLSREFNQDALIGKTLELVISATRSQKGAILIKDDVFRLRAIADKKSDYVIRYANDDFATISNVPVSVIRYVIRSKNHLLLDDIDFSDGHYDREYFNTSNLKEALCLPVKHQNEVQAILYLESNNDSSVYDDISIKTVSLLAYQMSTSLNNAKLYDSLSAESKKLKDIAEKLEESEERFSLSTKYSELGVWEWDIKTGELFWGEMVGPMIGGTAEPIETSFENFNRFVHPDDRKKLDDAIQVCFEGGEYRVEHRVVWEDGTVRWIEEAGDVMRDEHGQPIRMLGTAKDITRSKENEAARIALKTQLQQAQKMEALGQLTGGIAHDFNNLLGANLGFSQLLADKISDLNDAKMSEYIDQVIKSAKRASHLVAQMLAFSRTNEMESSVINISPVVQETTKMLSSVMPSSIKINNSIETELPCVISNPVQLNQILMNICINARDAIGEHGYINISSRFHESLSSRCISCHSEFSGNYVEISIADSGSGIDPDSLRDIFNPFFTTKDVGQGTGMGLSMVHGIMHGHNGHIKVESIHGEGSVFRLYLQASLDKEKNDSVDNEPVHLSADEHSRHILVVDDESSIVLFMNELLSDNGYEVTTFTDSESALEEINSNLDKYDCLITDQTMPGVSGYGLATAAINLNKSFPVIICSGYSEHLNANKAEEAGISSYMTKPVRISDLLRKLDEIL